jgi:hypothetical protein
MDRRHGHENFQDEFLVGVYRHSVGELHPNLGVPTSSKYPYENPTLEELDPQS